MERLICDSREQKNQHILAYLQQQNIPYTVRKMDVGDYQLEGQDRLVIDRKQDLEELSRNLMNPKDKKRFWREVRRARDKGIKLYILVEHGAEIASIPDVSRWHSDYSRVTGRALMEEIFRCHMAYGVEFIFTEKPQMAEKILEILTVKAD